MNFLQLYLAGRATPAEIHHFTDQWHRAQTRMPLHTWLGMTWVEYADWFDSETLPTAESHELQAQYDHVLIGRPGGRRLIQVHGPVNCMPPCAVHDPSEHPMAHLPLDWGDDSVLERVCEHGTGHPDPDDVEVRLCEGAGVHTCDGCCFGSGPGNGS